jgi:hypothetical protein
LLPILSISPTLLYIEISFFFTVIIFSILTNSDFTTIFWKWIVFKFYPAEKEYFSYMNQEWRV